MGKLKWKYLEWFFILVFMSMVFPVYSAGTLSKPRIVSFNVDNRIGALKGQEIHVYQCTRHDCSQESRFLLGTVKPDSLGAGWKVSVAKAQSIESVKRIELVQTTQTNKPGSICTADLTVAPGYIVITVPDNNNSVACHIKPIL